MSTLQVKAEAELNDECTSVTLTFHDIPVHDLADVLTAIGHPKSVQHYVDGVSAQVPIRRAGGPETRRVFRVERRR